MPAAGEKPAGVITRGTTAPNRLRRVDRWLVAQAGPLLRAALDPLVVDLGFGASPVTTVELAARLRRVRRDIEVVGLEIDPARVAAARPLEAEGLRFALGGFELPVGRPPLLVRAFNVLRQYAEDEVVEAWATMVGRLAPESLLIEGTCDEVGRRAAWVRLGPDGPRSLTLATHLASLDRPCALAARLPKALISRNVPGERIHALLRDLDASWDAAAAYASFGRRQRWTAACEGLRRSGWPVLDGPARWREGELTVAWRAVAPR